MTPEEAQQAETVEGVREALKDGGYIMDWEDVAAKLFIIVDSQAEKIEAMQKQLNAYSLLTEAAGSLMQKQYTEAELQAEFESSHSISYCIRALDGGYASERTAIDWKGWLDCARFLGAIKERGK
jgi:hypothetical protein